MSEDANRATVLPVDDDPARPRWSVLIPAWNCADYLAESLQSVLTQDRGPEYMEIIVIDDHSNLDDPEGVVRRLGQNRVRFIRQPQNVGKVRNYETGLMLSRGRFIHQLHADDRVLPGFYDTMESAFSTHSDAGAFFCESLYMNESGTVTGRSGLEQQETGILENWLEKIFVQQRIQTPSIVMRREVYETLGGFDRRLDAFEDWEMWIRVATRYPVGFVPKALAEYRSSASSATTLATTAGRNRAIIRCLFSIVDDYVPKSILTLHSSERRRAQAQYLIQFIPKLIERGQLRAALRTAMDALSFSRDPRTLYRMINYAITWKQLVST